VSLGVTRPVISLARLDLITMYAGVPVFFFSRSAPLNVRKG